MAKPLRLEFPGALYHVTSRGDGKEDIYLTDQDRECWLRIFGNTCERFNWVCHAYCLMGNHYHVVVETPDGNLSAGMRHLNGVYTQRFNRTHGRVGHVFQGRYKGILVEKDCYLLELSRYVILNPVRAGMVDDPRDWPWSSCRALVGADPAPAWLRTDWLLSHFGRLRKRAITKYIDFVGEGTRSPSIWDNLRDQIYLGSDDFIESMKTTQAREGDLEEVPRTQRRSPAKPLRSYVQSFPERAEAMARSYLSGDYTMKQIAQYFRVHYSTVSRAVRAFEPRQR